MLQAHLLDFKMKGEKFVSFNFFSPKPNQEHVYLTGQITKSKYTHFLGSKNLLKKVTDKHT